MTDMDIGQYISTKCPLIASRAAGWGVLPSDSVRAGLEKIANGMARLGFPIPAQETPVTEYLDGAEAFLRTLVEVSGKLSPCPFCGRDSKNQIYNKQQPDGSVIAFIICDGCGAVVSFRPNLHGEAALKAYNTRTTWH